MRDIDSDLAELREMWERRRVAAAPFRELGIPAGLTRPARDPDERAFLAQRNDLGPYVEVDHPTYRIWRTGKHGTALEVIDKWNRGELGPEDDPWNQPDDAESSDSSAAT